jgi:ABC-type glutathione transport system ATPase component
VSAPTLRIAGLSVAYSSSGESRTEVLRNLSLAVAPGEVLGVTGEGGSGKSTLIEAAVGILPPVAEWEGTVEIDGRALDAGSARERQRLRGATVGTILSGGRALLNPMARVGDQIANVLRDHGADKETRRRRALELLEEVGIPDAKRRARSYPHELSGGMAQRIVIAMAIACRPRLILADEPTRGLDVTIAADILDLLGGLIAERGAAAVIATRDLGIVAQHCTRVAVLRDGAIEDDVAVGEFFPRPPSAYGRELLAAEYSILRARSGALAVAGPHEEGRS